MLSRRQAFGAFLAVVVVRKARKVDVRSDRYVACGECCCAIVERVLRIRLSVSLVGGSKYKRVFSFSRLPPYFVRQLSPVVTIAAHISRRRSIAASAVVVSLLSFGVSLRSSSASE